MKFRGMLEACKQQLGWGVERYAHLPHPPEFLEMKDVPSFWKGLGIGLVLAPLWFVGWIIGAMALGIVCWVCFGIYGIITEREISWVKPLNFIVTWIALGGSVVCVLSGPFNHFRVKVANGNKPRENARRQKAYEEAVASALKAAEPFKAAEDHRLRCQIRELEGLAKTVGEKEADVRRILAKL
jgi:hypothetical protein